MSDTTANIDIICTKLHRPPVTKDLVPRTQLLERLEYHRQRPLTLISAQAGYGKSTLASSWLDASACPGAWVSLDDDENDLGLFVTYVTAALHTLFPDALRHTQALLHTSELPSGKVIARILLNELALIEDPFILVLDDYHRIRAQTIHDLLDEVLRHPPSSLHLVLITRRDPQISLPTLRARGQVTEVRLQDLRFSTEETVLFLQRALDRPIDDRTAEILHTKTEGWVTGLRLAALSFHNSPGSHDGGGLLSDLPKDNRYVADYLVSEVLSRQPAAIQDYLFATAILNRFCARLCEAMCPKNDQEACEMSGQDFLAWLEQTNLFVIALDNQQQWFRYHHMFQKFLLYRVHRQHSPEEVTALHTRASQWFAEQGLIDEALRHALAADDIPAAAQLVARHRHDLINRELWNRLERWLDLLPDDSIEEYPELLMARAWYLWNRMRWPDMADALDRVESLVAARPTESATSGELLGEIDCLRGVQWYIGAPCDGLRALNHAQKAVQRIPSRRLNARGLAFTVLVMSYQMTGDLNRAHSLVSEALKERQVFRSAIHTRLLVSLCHMYWIEADLSKHRHTAEQLLQLCNELDLPESTAHARYFCGVGHYCRNELAEAESYLADVDRGAHVVNVYNFAHCGIALALTYQAQGRQAEAREVAELAVSRALATSNTPFLQLAQAFQAELALRQGNVAGASQWANTYSPEPFSTVIYLYAPQLTLAKWLLAQGSTESLMKAGDLLSRLHDFYLSIHNKRSLMEVLLLQALLHDSQGDEQAALSTLADALVLAEPGGFIRPFIDVGPHMASLVQKLMHHQKGISYSGKILAAFRDEELRTGPHASQHQIEPSSSLSSRPFIEDLTNREFEILQLLAQRFSNQEIADSLFISSRTVKRHLYNLYQKLDVHGRREALAKARALQILSDK